MGDGSLLHGITSESSRAAKSFSGREFGDIKKFLRLPLVSVVVINFNYGRFLRAAVDSVFGQTYPNVECIVVDNGSTDESGAVLQAIEARYANVKIIRRAENGGQNRAALEGFAASAGPYVIFLDADDLLLPTCIETHIFVHLSLRIHVGFTSGDMLQLSGDQVVLGTEHAFNRVMLSSRGIKPRAARPYRHLFGETWPPEDFDRRVLETIRFVGLTNQWVWAPTSGNCFRRDALNLFADNPALQILKTGTDLYFCLGINAVSGSVLIDVPVAAYRLHGGNILFAKAPTEPCSLLSAGWIWRQQCESKSGLGRSFDRAGRSFRRARLDLDQLSVAALVDGLQKPGFRRTALGAPVERCGRARKKL